MVAGSIPNLENKLFVGGACAALWVWLAACCTWPAPAPACWQLTADSLGVRRMPADEW
jgi:hypothetical protein